MHERYVYDGQNVLLVLGSAGNLKERELYAAAVDQVLASDVPGQPTVWVLADNQGSLWAGVQQNVASNGVGGYWMAIRDYGSYGQPVDVEGSCGYTVRFGYAGMQFDATTGLYYDGTRWYDPSVGQYLSEEPSDPTPADPNLHRYCLNSPPNGTNPGGQGAMSPMATAAGFPCYGGGASTVGAGVVRLEGGHGVSATLIPGEPWRERPGRRRRVLAGANSAADAAAGALGGDAVPLGLGARPDQQPIHQPAQQFEQRPPGPPKGCRHRQRGGGPREKCDNGPVQPRGLDTAGLLNNRRRSRALVDPRRAPDVLSARNRSATRCRVERSRLSITIVLRNPPATVAQTGGATGGTGRGHGPGLPAPTRPRPGGQPILFSRSDHASAPSLTAVSLLLITGGVILAPGQTARSSHPPRQAVYSVATVVRRRPRSLLLA